MRIKIIHKRASETASDYVSCVSVGLLRRSLTNYLFSVVACWLFIRNRTAEKFLKWKNKDWREIGFFQALSFKLGNLVEVRYLGNLLYLDSPNNVDRQRTMDCNCTQWFFFFFFPMCSMIWKTDNWEWLINLDIHLHTVGDNETLPANSGQTAVNCHLSFSFSGKEDIN